MQEARVERGETGLILCVEDEADLRADILEELRGAGYGAIGAGNGREALEILGIARPDLIVCDVMMPEMSGYDLLEAVRAERADLGDVPFMFLTALNARSAVISGKRAGVDDYLVKPIDFDLMLASVEARLAGTQRMRALHAQNNHTVGDALRRFAAPTQGAATDIAAEVLDILGFGVVLADAQGEVLFANAFARALSAQTQAISLGGRMRATTPEMTRQLQTHLAEVATAAGNGDDIMRGLAIPRADGAGEVMLVICALGQRQPGEARAPLTAVFITDTQRKPAPPEHMLAALFGLTPAEAHVAHGLIGGRRTADIARDLKISQTTVAFHLRNLFEKTGAHRQVDLVALIMNTLAAVK